jgi:HEAT repeat protein
VRKSAAKSLDTLGWTPGRDEAAAAYWIAKGQWDKCDPIGEPAVAPLIRALNDADSDVRSNAADVLGKIGGFRAVRTLIRALNDADLNVCRRAADALGRIGEPAVEPLIKALNDSDIQRVRVNAADALATIGDNFVSSDDNRTAGLLLRVLKDSSFSVKREAAKALGKLSHAYEYLR